MSKLLMRTVLLCCVGAVSACANLNSIGRSTVLPPDNAGKAVHLDAQQRTLIVNDIGLICAEPSPDALAAYAASLGLGISAPGTGAGSLAGGQQSSAASIGLRTQSITLMRDALYRMCEAYANGAISPAQIATLLGRSQDLTAVILAVEQLTGAVAANQVALTGSTSASASASLVSNQQLLDGARESETAKQVKLDEAKADLEAKKQIRDEKEVEEASARDRLAAAADDQRAGAQDNLEQQEDALRDARANVVVAERLVSTRQKILDDAKATREAIEAAKNAALTSAEASTGSAGQFSAPAANKELSAEASKEISEAVEKMVLAVLRKEYTEDACMAMLTYVPADYDDWAKPKREYLNSVQQVCTKILLTGLTQRITVASYGPDESTERISSWLDSDEINRGRLSAWLTSKALNMSVTLLMRGAENAGLRNLAISELSIP